MSFALLVLSLPTQAARPPGAWLTDTFSLSSGLPGSDIRAIEMMVNGELLVGTDLGLVIFDGQDFSPVPAPPLWSTAFVRAALPVGDTIYVQSDRGLYAVVDGEPVILDEHPQFTPAELFAQPGGGILLASEQGVQRITHSETGFDTEFLSEIPARAVISEGETIWFGAETGLYRLSGGSVVEVAEAPVRRFLSDPDGLLVGREDGLFRLNGEKIPIEPRCFVTDMARLSDDRIALACGDGVRIGKPGESWEVLDADSGLPGPVTTTATVDHHGLLWIGTYGNGLVRVNSLDALVWTADSGLFSNQITTLTPDGEGLLIGGLGGAVRVEADFSVTPLSIGHDVRQIVRGRTGALFTQGFRGITRSDDEGSAVIEETEERYGALYRGAGGQVILFSPTTHSAMQLTPIPGGPMAVDPDLLTAGLRPGPGGQLWAAGEEQLWRLDDGELVAVGSGPGHCRSGTIAMVDEALYVSCSRGVFVRDEGAWSRVMEARDRPITGLLVDDSELWALGGDRLHRLLPERLDIGADRGLSGMRLISGRSAASFSGWLIAIADQGVIWLRKGAFETAPKAPTARIEVLLLRGEPVEDPSALGSSDTFLEVRAGADFLGSSEQVLWRFRLDASDWSPAQQSPRINLPGMAPGAHTVQVQVSAQGSGWSPAAETGFSIARPLASRPELWAALGGVLALIGGLIWRERERLLREKLREFEAREALQLTFGQYVNPKVAQAAMSGALLEEGELRQVTVLFADIRGFTPLSQQLEPRELVSLLNEWLAVAVEEVESRGGIINKFLGDAVVAVFGAPEDLKDHAERATLAAEGLIRSTRALGPELRARYGRAINISVGINTGTAVAGPVGTAARREYTIIGEAVNIAARVEALTRKLQVDVLLTEATVNRLRGRHTIKEQGEHRLAGLREPVLVWSLEA
ncbi:MAG: class 3 adenylate cyclase [Myxococcota bacterium]